MLVKAHPFDELQESLKAHHPIPGEWVSEWVRNMHPTVTLANTMHELTTKGCQKVQRDQGSDLQCAVTALKPTEELLLRSLQCQV